MFTRPAIMARMDLRHAAALALLILASCGPDIATIDRATRRAELAASRAEISAAKSESASQAAAAAAARAETASNVAEDSARRANDVISRMCSVGDPVWEHLPNGRMWPPYLNPDTPEYARRQLWLKACSRT